MNNLNNLVNEFKAKERAKGSTVEARGRRQFVRKAWILMFALPKTNDFFSSYVGLLHGVNFSDPSHRHFWFYSLSHIASEIFFTKMYTMFITDLKENNVKR